MAGGLIHCFLYYGAIRYVTSKHKPFGANLAQLGCYLLASLGIDIGEGDTSALFSHAQRRCCSNTSPCSSDESNSSVKSSHASVSFLFSYKICVHEHKGFDKPPIETVYHIEQVLFSQPVSPCSFQAGYPLRADQRAMASTGGQNHAITWGEINISGDFGIVRENEANGATHAVEHLFVTMAMHGIGIARAIRPGVRREAFLLHTLA